MIFTIEPALTIPEERVYVRLEDTILITPTGYENLSATLPVQIEDIERLMSEEGLGEMMRRRSQPTTSSAQVRR
jgi:Xaa-Pro aminopeptidase